MTIPPAANKSHESAEGRDAIRHLAFHDTLTGLPNRASLSEHLAATLLEIANTREETAVLFIDLDGFKTVNDTLGHQAGDELLVEVAKRLRHSVRSKDLVARFGGDEFVIILNRVNGGDPERIAAAILTSLEKPIEVVGRQAYVSASIGVAVGPKDGTTPEELLRNADNALYRAKEAGRATVQVYTSAMHLMSSAKFLMEESLRKAISRNEFFLEYQPIVETVSGKVVAAEALIRWRHPLRDVVLPHEFIPLAEEAGIIEDIGRWTVSSAVSQVRAWETAGVSVPIISLNVSSRELRQKHFVSSLINTLEQAGGDCSKFRLELTHGSTPEKLNELREAGFHLVIDDFGRSYSSIFQLKQMPFSGLKIDPVFVQSVSDNPAEQATLKALIDLGHTLGMEICSEGVETEAQRDFLKTAGCDSIQGYLVSPPLSPEDFLGFIRS